MWRRRLASLDVRWLLLSFAALLIAGTWTLTLRQLDESRRLQVADARRDAHALVRLFSEHTSRTLEAADQAVIFLRHRYDAEGARLAINDELRDGLGPTSQLYNQFSIVDAHADVILSSLPFKAVNVADREHIRVHLRAGDDQLYVSRPVLGRLSNKWSLQLTRRISYPDGRFKGVVVVSMDPQYFIQLYHDIDVGRQGSIALVGTDGVMRVRRVGEDASQGQDVGASTLFAAMRAQREGMLIHAGPIDGRRRIYAFQRLERFPLYVLVGIDLDERMSHFETERGRALRLATGATVVVALFTLALHWLLGQLLESRARAVAANLAKSRFLANMSHELRTPLNAVLGYSELLQNEMGDSRGGRFAAAIHTSGARLLELVEAVLELSALESGREGLRIGPVALDELPARVRAGHGAAAAAKGLELRIVTAPALPASWHGDGDKLLRVIDILLRNAIAATATGAVTLRLAPGALDGLRCEVSDTGPGVPAEARRHIFGKFSQADDSATRGKQGAGLGLAIAARMTELMGGRIWLQKNGGPGAVFIVELPRQKAPHDGAAA